MCNPFQLFCDSAWTGLPGFCVRILTNIEEKRHATVCGALLLLLWMRSSSCQILGLAFYYYPLKGWQEGFGGLCEGLQALDGSFWWQTFKFYLHLPQGEGYFSPTSFLPTDFHFKTQTSCLCPTFSVHLPPDASNMFNKNSPGLSCLHSFPLWRFSGRTHKTGFCLGDIDSQHPTTLKSYPLEIFSYQHLPQPTPWTLFH